MIHIQKNNIAALFHTKKQQLKLFTNFVTHISVDKILINGPDKESQGQQLSDQIVLQTTTVE